MLRPYESLLHASRFHALIEYGGLARTTLNVESSSPLRNAGSDSVLCQLQCGSLLLRAEQGSFAIAAVM